MRIAPFALAALLFVAPSSRAADDDTADVVVRKWLVLAPVDVAARRPLRPDAVFAKYLLDRASPPPKEGEELTGTLGKSAKWATKEATTSKDPKEDGEVEADGWSYASVESAADRVAIAKLEGAGALFVNGAGFTGDVYELGDAGVPVALRKGANDVYVAGPRGGFRLTLKPPQRNETGAANFLDVDDHRSVLPDRVEGETSDQPWSWRGFNATSKPIPAAPFVPLGVTSIKYAPGDPGPTDGGPTRPLVKANKPRRRTFISNIDGSVQSYALVPPLPGAEPGTKIGLVLSLHGAGVECMNQAKAYAPKPDFWIVCPTNRGNYGFDWQDWGRLDAYEVLDDALKVTGVDPRRVYLTGHSMGGHGTWHLAANDPGRFLAIAPSAGWCSWDTYQPSSQVMSPLAWMWRAADGASWTKDLIGNLAQIPTYVLHGEKDDNVPASEAHAMLDALTKAGGHPESHFEPGAGHWWDKDEKTPGADCVDWPGIWELFRKTQPADRPQEVSFTTTDTSVDATRSWVTIVQPIDYGRPSRFTLTEQRVPLGRSGLPGVKFVVTTENVRRLRIHAPELQLPDAGIPTVIDGQTTTTDEIESPTGGAEWQRADFIRTEHGWSNRAETVGGEKSSWHTGPFKRAFTNRFVLVYGTAGDESENRELLEKARYDSEVWAYRANGDANLMSDAQFLAGNFRDRNVIVYGNADTNKAWGAVFDDDCPIGAKRGVMTVNGTKHEGVVAAAFVRPRKGSDVALAAAFADTGAAATRLFYQFPVFSSGVGIPDYVVFGPGFLFELDGDVRAAGWFDYAWRMK